MSESFFASRLTQGNRIFPTRIEVSRDRVTRIQPRFFGSTEESIAIPNVASVQIATGLLFSDIRIDSTGGSNPIESHGHTKGDARRIRELIEQFQKASPDR